MRTLTIPQAAYDAADQYLANKSDDDDSLGAVDAAAPHIVAAELRAQAFKFQQRSDNVLMTREGHGQERVATLRQVADELILRADELDPDGSAARGQTFGEMDGGR